jgi:hypothetical protein
MPTLNAKLEPTRTVEPTVEPTVERLNELVSDLETALRDAERQRRLIANLRDEAAAIAQLFEPKGRKKATR